MSHECMRARSRGHLCAFLLFCLYFSSMLHPSLSYSLAGPSNSPAAGGVVITVAGPLVQPISIAIGATPCASLVIVSVDSVACTVAAGTGASLDVKAYTQTIPSYFSYDAPLVSRCSGVSAAGGSLLLTGSNFGSSELVGSRALRVAVAGTAVWSRWLSDSSVMLMAPAGAGRLMALTVLPPPTFPLQKTSRAVVTPCRSLLMAHQTRAAVATQTGKINGTGKWMQPKLLPPWPRVPTPARPTSPAAN